MEKKYVFWKYDLFPFCLWAEISKETESHVTAKGYGIKFPISKVIIKNQHEGELLIDELEELRHLHDLSIKRFRSTAKSLISFEGLQ